MWKGGKGLGRWAPLLVSSRGLKLHQKKIFFWGCNLSYPFKNRHRSRGYKLAWFLTGRGPSCTTFAFGTHGRAMRKPPCGLDNKNGTGLRQTLAWRAGLRQGFGSKRLTSWEDVFRYVFWGSKYRTSGGGPGCLGYLALKLTGSKEFINLGAQVMGATVVTNKSLWRWNKFNSDFNHDELKNNIMVSKGSFNFWHLLLIFLDPVLLLGTWGTWIPIPTQGGFLNVEGQLHGFGFVVDSRWLWN